MKPCAKKIITAITILLLMPLLAVAFDFYMRGTIDSSLALQNTQLDASFGPEFISRASGTIPLNNAGSVGVAFSFSKNFTSGSVELRGMGSGAADMSADTVNNKLTINSLSWTSRTQLGEWQQDAFLSKTFSGDIMLDGEKAGSFSIYLSAQNLEEGNNQLTFNSGTLTVNLQFEDILDELNIVTNAFAGYVTSTTNQPIASGQVFAQSGSYFASVNIVPVGDKGGYGFYGTPLIVSGIVDSNVDFYVGTSKVKTLKLTGDTAVRHVDLQAGTYSSADHFSDTDLDGVPNEADLCPLTWNAVVNADGCSCPQLMEMHNNLGSCEVTTDQGPLWSPPPPPVPQCDELERNSCLVDSPKFCTNDLQVIDDCERCGCPSDTECNPQLTGVSTEEGKCYQIERRTELRCLKNEYKIGTGLNCSELGDSWIDVFKEPGVGDITEYVTISTSANFWAGGSSHSEAKRQARKWLQRQKLCINSENLGCIIEDNSIKCPGEEEFYLTFDDVSETLDKVLNSKFGRKTYGADVATTVGQRVLPMGIIPAIVGAIVNSIGAACCGKVEVDFSINRQALPDFPLRYTKQCDSVIASGVEECTAFGTTSHSANSYDFFFIGDGFADDNEMQNSIALLLDSGGLNAGTANEGLFSRAPFKNSESNFNIWTKNVQSINHTEEKTLPENGKIPAAANVQSQIPSCPQRDIAIVVSKTENYKSQCPTSQLCYLSIASEQYPGRALLKLVGESFGLADESYFNITEYDVPGHVTDFDHLKALASPNCKKTQADAEEVWGSMVRPNEMFGYFKSCGGECGNECAEFVRPTFNSAMRDITKKCIGLSCVTGPPFDAFYLVNEKAILEGMGEFEVSS